MSTRAALRHTDRLAALWARQCGVASRRQLQALGVTANDIRNQLEAHRWQAIGRAIVVHTGPLSAQQQLWVAVLSQADGAALAGITSAIAGGLDWRTGEHTHVLLPAGSRVSTTPGVVVHLSRVFRGIEHHDPVRLPPRTPMARSVVDAANWARNDRQACGVLCAAVQQRLTVPEALRAAHEAAGPTRRRRLIGLTIGDIEGGAQSFAEIDFGVLAAEAGLPPPVRQAFRLDADGRRRFLDVFFRRFSAEVDGAIHLLPQRYWEDMHRHNALTISGERVLHFSTVGIRLDRAAVVAQLRQAGATFGV